MKRKFAIAAISLGSMLAVSSAAFAEDAEEGVNVETVTENTSEESASYEVINSGSSGITVGKKCLNLQ